MSGVEERVGRVYESCAHACRGIKKTDGIVTQLNHAPTPNKKQRCQQDRHTSPAQRFAASLARSAAAVGRSDAHSRSAEGRKEPVVTPGLWPVESTRLACSHSSIASAEPSPRASAAYRLSSGPTSAPGWSVSSTWKGLGLGLGLGLG